MATDSDLTVALRVLHALRQREALNLLDEALAGLGLEPVTVTIPANARMLADLNASAVRRRARKSDSDELGLLRSQLEALRGIERQLNHLSRHQEAAWTRSR